MTSESDAVLKILRDRGVLEPLTLGVVLGSGLSNVGEVLEDAVVVPYADLPGFPTRGVSGHAGELAIGQLEGQVVAMLKGRSHYYERGDATGMRVPLEVLAGLGCPTLLATNAAGSLHPDWYPGSLALISDHIAFSGLNPLIGSDGDDRFVSMANAYDSRLRLRLKRAATAASVANMREGIYMMFSGPSFETAAEVRMAKLLGADLVGMSTVPEVILARHHGMKVAGISVITNFGTGIAGGNPSHGETKQVALSGSVAFKRLLRAFARTTDVITA